MKNAVASYVSSNGVEEREAEISHPVHPQYPAT